MNDNDQTIIFESVTPAANPVSIAELLNDIEAVIKKHVILPEHAAAALAVWVLHTYTFERRDTVAYVAIESPEKRCGKTTLLSVLAAMAHKPLIASNVTVAALFRAIDTCRPALFIDEADTFLAGNATMRGIINSGNTFRTAYILRLQRQREVGSNQRDAGPNCKRQRQRDVGPGYLPPLFSSAETENDAAAPNEGQGTGLKKFSSWCPKVIAMIGRVPDTIADRSIVVHMNRKLVSETCAPLAELNTALIRSKCARFARDTADAVAGAPKIRGEGLNDRAADTFDPLYVIARLAGAEWEQKLHTAALALAATVSSQNPSTELLLDILSVCAEYHRERIFSSDLVAFLRYGESAQAVTSAAVDYSTIDEVRIAQLLRPYGVKPVNIRIGREVHRGYQVPELREAMNRYVPKGEIQARLSELKQRSRLEDEARKETTDGVVKAE